jgi:hypothetical protein
MAKRVLLSAAAEQIAYYQRRNATARRSHAKTTVLKLHALGIQISRLPICRWRTEVLWMNEQFMHAKALGRVPVNLSKKERIDNKVNPPRPGRA